MSKICAEMRCRFRTGNFEWDFGSGAVLTEKRIHWFQHQRLPAGYHLREFRVHSRLAMKIEYLSVQAVSPSQVRFRSRNFELQLRKRNNSIAETECALHIGVHVRSDLVLNRFRFTLASET